MKASAVSSRAGAAVLLVAALAALAMPPLLLSMIIGNPLPAWPVDWARVVETVQAGLVPSSVWVDGLAVLAWLAWLSLVGTLAVEVLAVARNRPSAPVVPRWIRQLAQTLVAAAIALAGPGQQPVAAGTAGVSFVAAAAPIPDGGSHLVQTERSVDGRLVTVAEGDSWSGFATALLGDGAHGPRLRQANLGRDVGGGHTVTASTAFVEPGWELVVPADLDTGTTPPRTPSVEETTDNESVTVEPGDHFWAIAEDTLTETWDRVPSDDEIVPYWRQLVDENRDRLLPPGDPDLIYPEQQLTIPTPPSAPPASAAPKTTEAAGQRAPDSGSEPVEDNAVANDENAVEAHPPDVPGSDTGWQGAIEDQPTHQSTGDEGAAGASVVDHADDVDDEPRTFTGAPVGLTRGVAATSLLAAGVVATLRWRRRTAMQQRLPGLRFPTPLPDVMTEEAKLAAAAVPERTLDDLAAMLATIPADTHPVFVTTTDDGEITLLFDENDDLPDPVTPWELAHDGTNGPVGWRAELGSRGPGRGIGLPLLVTLGRTGTTTVLANIAAMGTLVVEGEESLVRRRQRAFALEVATSRIAVPVEVATAGDERLGTLDRVRFIEDPEEEIRLGMEEIEQHIVLDDRTPRLLVCHRHIDPPVVPSELRGMVGVVTAAPSADAWRFEIEDEQTGRLYLPGEATVGLTLPDVDPDLVDDELTRLDGSAEAVAPPEEQTSGVADPATNGHPTIVRSGLTEPPWCEVRILGPVEVIADGRRVEGLTPRLLEVLTYLATHPGSSKGRVDAAVWPGDDAPLTSQRVTSALTKIRNVLGDGPDGEPLLPRRTGDEPIELSVHVGCDLDRALAHVDLARDLPAEARARELAAALELVRGEPFQSRPWSWATELQQQAFVNLQNAASEAARTLREVGDLETAETVVTQGRKLLDGNGWLYLEQAEIAKARGHPERARLLYDQYRLALDRDADETAGVVAAPPPELELAFSQLLERV